MNETQTQTGMPAKNEASRDQAALALKSTVVEGAREVTDDIRHLAGDVADQAKKKAESTLSGGQKRAAEGLGTVANAIRKTGEQLREDDQSALTEYLDRAAHQVDAAAEYLQRRTLGQVVGDVEQFARREPALFLGGAFVAGLVGGRFLKSSRSEAPARPQAMGTRDVSMRRPPQGRDVETTRYSGDHDGSRMSAGASGRPAAKTVPVGQSQVKATNDPSAKGPGTK